MGQFMKYILQSSVMLASHSLKSVSHLSIPYCFEKNVYLYHHQLKIYLTPVDLTRTDYI